jgi:hypothetical protein
VKTSTVGGGCGAILVVAALNFLWIGWLVMLLVGAIHSFVPGVQTISYWTSVLIAIPLSLLFGALFGGSK